MLEGFLVGSTTIFTLLFLIWSKSSIENLLVKIMLFILSIVGIFVTLQQLGFIIKVG